MITSFENPNYHLVDDDALNSNIPTPLSPQTAYYQSDSIYHDIISSNTNTNSTDNTTYSTKTLSPKKRSNYNQIDLVAMGVEDAPTPDSECSFDSRKSSEYSSNNLKSDGQDTSCTSEESDSEENGATPEPTRTSFLEFYARLGRTSGGGGTPEEKNDNRKEEDEYSSRPPEHLVMKDDITSISCEKSLRNCINSPDSNDSGIQVTSSPKDVTSSPEDVTLLTSEAGSRETCSQNTEDEVKVLRRPLPPGWEKHEDEDGAYYWHVKSGTIQRETPTRSQRPLSITNDISLAKALTITSPTISTTSDMPGSVADSADATADTNDYDHLSEFERHAFKYASQSMKNLYTGEEEEDTPVTVPALHKPARFAVRSLGWVQINEEELTPERSSKAVNRCIVALSLGRNDLSDAVGRWGDGKDLYMHLNDEFLTLVDPQDGSILNKQNIQSIRVWGVGRDNGRDFAYVARDRLSRRYMCHVFRCDIPARHIANGLRDICRKLMAERTHRVLDTEDGRNVRPNNLPNLEKHSDRNHGQKITFQNLYKRTSFPTPMEEPRKVLRAHYLGSTPVPRAGGVEILNTAMEEVFNKKQSNQWKFVSVSVAPSTITITDPLNPDILIAECRVRFLSFMGIAMSNAKLCGFIMHTAADTFTAHVFHCEPSAGNLCKTIEAACKLRYQKCLDAHHPSTIDHSKTQPAKLFNYLRTGMQSVVGRFRDQRSSSSDTNHSADSSSDTNHSADVSSDTNPSAGVSNATNHSADSSSATNHSAGGS